MAAAAEEEDRVLHAQCAASDEQTAGLLVIGVLTALGNRTETGIAGLTYRVIFARAILLII